MPQPVRAPGGAARRASASIYFGSTSPAMDEALDALQADGIHVDALRVRAFPFQRRGRSLHRRAREGVRRRAEPRRAAAHAAGQRAGDRPGAARAGAALRRHADHGALHHRGDRRARARRQRRADREGQGGSPHDLPRQAQAAPPDAADATSSASRGATTKARSPRCAPAAATTRSRPRIIQACWELDIEPHRVAKLSGIGCSRRRRTTSSATRTASTPCTAACRRC